jgi:xanthine/CO dehydrogenase XdhC/CoxF family maturation factor
VLRPVFESRPAFTRKRDLSFIGMIGSQTKWATFSVTGCIMRGFSVAELAQVICPIVPGIHGKVPEVIAVAVAAQSLQTPCPPAPVCRRRTKTRVESVSR